MEISVYRSDDPDRRSEEFIEQRARKLKVCGHPMRLRLLCRIAREEEPCVSDLSRCLDKPQPVISQHLAVLRQRGIVASEVRGNRRVYAIVDPFFREIVEFLINAPTAVPEEVGTSE